MAKKKTSTQIRSEAMKASWARRRNSPMREQARRRASKPKDNGRPKFWILWAPISHKPPRVRFTTLEKVKEVADIMVKKYRCSIYVMESVECHNINTQVEVVKYTGKSVKEPKAEPCPPETFLVSNPPLSMQGQLWDDTQDKKLTRLYWEFRGYSDLLTTLAKAMGRSELAIEYRLEALGIRRRSE